MVMPHCFMKSESTVRYESIGFFHSSENVHPALIYLGFLYNNNNKFLSSQIRTSRKALPPINPITILQLEQISTFLLVQSMGNVCSILSRDLSVAQCQTNSAIALCWIKM